MSKNKAKDVPKVPKTIENRKARHDYELVETHEAGIALAGSEVKSVFLGRVNMTDAYVRIKEDELWLMNLDIEPYEHASRDKPERRRDRKLLMHRKQIDLLGRKSQEKSFAIIPIRMYFKNGRVKVEIALGRGKREYDKRDQLKKDETRRELERLRGRRE
jgi:SsrA-binding protein